MARYHPIDGSFGPGVARHCITLALFLWIAAFAQPARAQGPLDSDSKALFDRATAAMKEGAPNEAIAQLELLADRGVVHPDVSFNRAVAYVQRSQTPRAQPGDMGRAVASLEETLSLRPSDAGALAVLESVQSELSRDRSRRRAQSLLVRPSIGRALVRLLPENFWAIPVMIASGFCTLGLLAAWLGRSPRRRFVGRVVASISGAIGILSGTLLVAAAETRHAMKTGVVTVPEARLRDAAGMPLPVSVTRDTASIPEGARVDIARINDRYAEVLWGETKAWIQTSDVQLISPPSNSGALTSH